MWKGTVDSIHSFQLQLQISLMSYWNHLPIYQNACESPKACLLVNLKIRVHIIKLHSYKDIFMKMLFHSNANVFKTVHVNPKTKVLYNSYSTCCIWIKGGHGSVSKTKRHFVSAIVSWNRKLHEIFYFRIFSVSWLKLWI